MSDTKPTATPLRVFPRVTIVSPFRQNGAAYVKAYFDRAYALTGQDRLRWIVVEGDSTDDTLKTLINHKVYDKRISLVKCDTGKPHYGSVVNKERFEILAMVFNVGLDAADLEWSDFVMLLPSDVLYEPDLIDRLAGRDADVIAPMFWVSEGPHGRFYDIWGFIHAGKNFPPNTPAWYAATYPQDGPLEMDTVGGCILMKSAVLKAGCRYGPDDVDHQLCQAAKAAGFGVYADLDTHIFHP